MTRDAVGWFASTQGDAHARRTVLFPQAGATPGAGRPGFSGRQPPALIKAAQVNRLVERLGVLQIDSVNAVVRSHYLPLFSRLGHYSPLILEQAAWSSGRRRSLFEYWGHEASLLPMALYPLMRWRMERAARGQGIYQQMARFGREQQATIARVLGIVEQQGALGAGSLSTREERAGPWWDWSDEKHALEWLFAAGGDRRRAAGFERLYDLPERVIPADILQQPPWTRLRRNAVCCCTAPRRWGWALKKTCATTSVWTRPTAVGAWRSWSRMGN